MINKTLSDGAPGWLSDFVSCHSPHSWWPSCGFCSRLTAPKSRPVNLHSSVWDSVSLDSHTAHSLTSFLLLLRFHLLRGAFFDHLLVASIALYPFYPALFSQHLLTPAIYILKYSFVLSLLPLDWITGKHSYCLVCSLLFFQHPEQWLAWETLIWPLNDASALAPFPLRLAQWRWWGGSLPPWHNIPLGMCCAQVRKLKCKPAEPRD